MTTLGRREECLRNLSEKEHLRMLRAHQMRSRSFPAPPEAPWAKTGPNLAGGGCLVYTTSWIGE